MVVNLEYFGVCYLKTPLINKQSMLPWTLDLACTQAAVIVLVVTIVCSC